jgi:hypothetical protein
MMIEAAEDGRQWKRIIRKAQRELSLSLGRVNGEHGRSARFTTSEEAAPGYPPLALSS